MGCFKRSKKRYLQQFRRQGNIEFEVFMLQGHAQRHSAASSANGSENSSAKSSEKLMAAPIEASDSGRGCVIEGIHEVQGKNGFFSGASSENVVQSAEALVDRAGEKIGLGPLGGFDERVGKLEEILKSITTGILLLQTKLDMLLKLMRKEMTELLQTGRERRYILLEFEYSCLPMTPFFHFIVIISLISDMVRWSLLAYEILELFCEFIVARVSILESQRECSTELRGSCGEHNRFGSKIFIAAASDTSVTRLLKRCR